MKKNNYLNSQELEQFNLSRREFFISTAMLAFSGVLYAAPAKQSYQVINAVNTMNVDASTERVGEWMRENIVPEKVTQIIKDVEERLKSNRILSINGIRDMISDDYSQGHTVDVSNIRFSAFEVALCITACACARQSRV